MRSPVARDEAGVRRGVVVVEQLEQEAEAAPLARDRLAEQAVPAVVVDRAVLQFGQMKYGTGSAYRPRSDPLLPAEERQLADRGQGDQGPGERIAEPPAQLRHVLEEVLPVHADEERGRGRATRRRRASSRSRSDPGRSSPGDSRARRRSARARCRATRRRAGADRTRRRSRARGSGRR